METKNNENKIIETNKLEIKYDEETGKKIINGFQIHEIIGRGLYSKVKKCVNTETKKPFATKILNKFLLKKKKKSFSKTEDGGLVIHYMLEDAMNEIATYKYLPSRHPNILTLYQILNDEEKEKTYLIMEYAEKGQLVTINEETGVFTINKNYNDKIYDEKLIKKWIKEVANGIKFLHDNNVVHGDIKPDNILIDKDGHCKLGDFGLSLILDGKENDLPAKSEGNIYFFPPEFIDEKEDKPFSCKPVDIWTFGISIYACIFKCLPFFPENRENIMELFNQISEAKFDFCKNGITISEKMKDLLSHMLDKDPEKRFTIDDILNYPWLNEA